MAANTATKVSASPNHITYRLEANGDGAGPTLANATILADMVSGPLRDAWNKTYASQAAMRSALLGGGQDCSAKIQNAVEGVDATATVNQVTADVDTDAITVTKAEINIAMTAAVVGAAGQIAFLTLEHYHSISR